MLVKKRKIPIRILINEVFINRLPKGHPKLSIIIKDTRIRKSGYKGEKELDYFLSFIESNEIYNFQDIRLSLFGRNFQMDSLITSSNFFTILDSKNLAGVVKYDSINRKLIQNYNGEIRRYQDPILQVHRQMKQLQYWLKRYHFRVPPMEILVVMTNPDLILDFDTQNESTKRIIYPDHALDLIDGYQNMYRTPILTKQDLNNLSKLILEKHNPKQYNLLKQYEITIEELIPGVQCPNCKKFSMIRKHRTWYCPDCQIHSNDAHEKAIIEFLLANSSITNQQCRSFLCLPPSSYQLVSGFLQKLNLPFTGNTKDRIYFLPYNKDTYLNFNIH